MNTQANVPVRNTKIMNRFDLTSRLVAKLKNDEAVVGGIGNTNFDLWAAGHRPQNFYMLGSMGLAFPIALGSRPGRVMHTAPVPNRRPRAVLTLLAHIGRLAIFTGRSLAAILSPPFYGRLLGQQIMRLAESWAGN